MSSEGIKMFSNSSRSKYSYILAMAIFGTIGVFRKYIALPSTVVVLLRCLIGMLFLLLLLRLKGKPFDREGVRSNLGKLLLSGLFLGLNWFLLFEAYRYTSVATATLCYYMAPVFVILISPLLFGERLTRRKILCVLLAMLGMFFVSGVYHTGFRGASELKGIAVGLGAAVFYAGLIVTNKKIGRVDAYDKTIVQLCVAALVLLPYILLREDFGSFHLTKISLAMLLVVGVLHTGIAYGLYIGSMEKLEAHTVALFSYIDPIVAIFMSTIFLRERMGIGGVIGCLLVLGATLLGDTKTQ